MSQRTKRNLFVIAVGAIFLLTLAPGQAFSLFLLVLLTTALLTGLAFLLVPKVPS